MLALELLSKILNREINLEILRVNVLNFKLQGDKNLNKTKIHLPKIKIFAYHGQYPEEKEIGCNFELDIEVEVDISEAVGQDSFNKTIDYIEIYNRVTNAFTSKKFNLMETAANFVADDLLAMEKIKFVKVKVHKPASLIQNIVQSIEVIVERKQ